MNKITRKIISGTFVLSCTVFGLLALTHITDISSVPVSLMSYEDEKTIIILDAEHGESP